MSRQYIFYVLIDLIIKTIFNFSGYNRYNTNRSIVLFFLSIIYCLFMISAYFSSFGKLRNHSEKSNPNTEKINHYLALISWLGYHLVVQSFLVSKFLIPFAITFLSSITEENSVGYLKYYFILKMLVILIYFRITCNNGSVSSLMSQQILLSFSIFNVFAMLQTNRLIFTAIFALSVKTLPPPQVLFYYS